MIDAAEVLRIVSLDTDKTGRSRAAPDSSMRCMYLKLSQRPDQDWVALFDAVRKFPRHSGWRTAWVEGQYIVVDCVPSELETHHLKDLKQDVESVNREHAELQTHRREQQAREAALEKQEADSLSALASKLNFD